MESQNRYDGIDAYAVTKVRFQARQLTRSRAFRQSDIEDIEQDLMLDLFRRLQAFDPSRASKNTFIARVVENRAASLIKATMAEKRGRLFEHEDLHAVVSNEAEGRLERGDTIPAENGLWATGTRGWDEAIELRRDLARLIRRLPPRLTSLCCWLATASVTEISRETGTPTSTIYDAIAKLHRAMSVADLEIYA